MDVKNAHQRRSSLTTPCSLDSGLVELDNVKIRVNDVTPSSSQECLIRTSQTVVRKGSSIRELHKSNHQIQKCHVSGTTAERCARKKVGKAKKTPVRRQSWSSLGITTSSDDQEKVQIQRRWSLSSMDSDLDETFYISDKGPKKANLVVWESSTHVDSLKETQHSLSTVSCEDCVVEQPGQPPGNDLAINNITSEEKIREPERMSEAECLHKNDVDVWPVLGHNTLQKSVSTPSILAAQEILDAVPQEVEKREGSHGIHDSDDDKPFGKRKKRGSLFFKKKWIKEKERDTKRTPHQFISVCYGNTASCDVCLKPLVNKPSLRCDKCLVTVHESSCKDQVHDCNKFKSSKSPSKPPYMQPSKERAPSSHFLPSGHLPHYPYRYRQLIGPVSQSMLHLVSTSSSKQSHSNPVHAEKRQSAPSIHQLYTSQLSSDLQSSEMESRSLTGSSGRCTPYTPSGYSQWRRVAMKLGVNRVINEEIDTDVGDEILTNITETNSASLESLDEGAQEISDLEDEPLLHLMDDEPEAWTANVDKKNLKKLKDKDVKRQESIYELIMTEKHHCLTLKIMQKVFAKGLIKELNMSKELVDRFFPCLNELIEVHMSFLRKLRERQRESIIVNTTGDVLLEQFQGETLEQMKVAYGEFCSNHKDAISIYKTIAKSDRKFQNFIKRCSLKRLCKTRGIPDCILLVTQRITKYPLLIQALIKATKDNKQEHQDLVQALHSVKAMISHVDMKVAEKERDRRLLEIYNKVDAKSTTFFRGKKFKKSDLLSNNRKLRFESAVSWKNSRGKAIDVIAVVLSDFIFFLQENNQKYYFASLDNKPGVVSLQKLLVRGKAGQNSRGIFLISSNPSEPEMYELNCSSVKSQKTWIDVIREAVEQCPDEDEGVPSETEEERKLEEARSAKLKELIKLLHEKDLSVAQICDDKIRILVEMLGLVGVESEMFEGMQYAHLLVSEKVPDLKEVILSAWNNASRLASNIYTSGTNLSRSVSSAGEHQSESFVSPLLPKRAETFGGFDNPGKEQNLPNKIPIFKKKFLHFKDGPTENVTLTSHKENVNDEENPEYSLHLKGVELRGQSNKPYSGCNSPEKQNQRHSAISSSSQGLPSANEAMEFGIDDLMKLTVTPLLISQGKEQLQQIVELAHHLNTLTCVLSHLCSRVDSLKTQLAEANEKVAKLTVKDQKEVRDKRPLYRPEHQLEELRNLQEQLSQEREAWQQEKNKQQIELDKQREELKHDQDQVKVYQADIEHQRELLYRKLEALQKEGIILSPSLTVVNLNSSQNKEVEPVSDSNAPGTGVVDKSAATESVQHRRCVSFDLQQNNEELGSIVSCSSSAPSTNDRQRNDPKFRTSHSASCLPTPGKRDSVPLHLCSATNMQKRQSISSQPIKQQLPLKLASRNSAPNGVITSMQSSQQILPMKLALGSGALPSNIPSLSGRSPPKTTAAKRSHSAASSPSSTLASPIHIRGGSSPALVQTSPVLSGVVGTSPKNNKSDSPVLNVAKAGKDDSNVTEKKEESNKEIFL